MNTQKLQTLLEEIVKAIVLLDKNTPYTFERYLSPLLTEAFAEETQEEKMVKLLDKIATKETTDNCSLCSKCDEKPTREQCKNPWCTRSHAPAPEKKWKLASKNCVNSKWIARFLTSENQECCQCSVDCKIRVRSGDIEFVVTEQEWLTMRGVTHSPPLRWGNEIIWT